VHCWFGNPPPITPKPETVRLLAPEAATMRPAWSADPECQRKPIEWRERRSPRLAKREGDIESACQVWRSAMGNSRQGYEAYEPSASYFEHKGRRPQKALEIVREALAELSRARQEGTILFRAFLGTQARFERRRQLERKTREVLTSVS
jgi:hypothetical protein